MNMKVSCLCPTFNRVPLKQWLLEEAIECFLRQDYQDKELIILNDCPRQTLVCKLPNVLVLNLPRRMSSLGEKRNLLVSVARGDVFFPWDDDDISLPTRLSKSIELLGDEYEYYNPARYWQMDSTGLRADHPLGVGHNCSAYRRDVFNRVGGYAHVSSGEDADIDMRMREHGKFVPFKNTNFGPAEWFYIYRWGVSSTHLSGIAQVLPNEGGYEYIGAQTVSEGVFELNPHWRLPYEQLTRDLAASGNNVMPLHREDLIRPCNVNIKRIT
ncbi:MAG: glycosyltransferase [Burkholderiales bacterium]